jgi:hypothetical protein
VDRTGGHDPRMDNGLYSNLIFDHVIRRGVAAGELSAFSGTDRVGAADISLFLIMP